MSPLTEPTKLTLRKTWQPMDPDAAAYITAVEAADTAAGQSGGLEEKTKIAIDNFVLGCKADGIWSAIKASCILAGARTFAGALIPLKGTPPNKFGTEGNWIYDRKLGLKGDGSTNYLNSKTAMLPAWQNNAHVSVYASTGGSDVYIGALGAGTTAGTQIVSGGFLRLNSSATVTPSNFSSATRLVALNRNSPSSIDFRVSSATLSLVNTSTTPATEELFVFARNYSSLSPTNARLAFYSIGESLNLALLDARVTDLINAFGAAIP